MLAPRVDGIDLILCYPTTALRPTHTANLANKLEKYFASGEQLTIGCEYEC